MPSDSQQPATPPGSAPCSGSEVWNTITDETTLPPLDEIVWLWDGQRVWLGGRADDGDCWLWGNTYGSVWHNGKKWDGDLETDDDYKPTHWLRLPNPPNIRIS